MPRAKNNNGRRPLDGHADMPVRQSVISASSAKAPSTTGAPSVFAMAAAAKPRKRPPLDPDAVEIRLGVPIPERRTQSDTYARLWQRLPVGGMVELPERNANALVAYAKKEPGAKVSKRNLGGGTFGVWRLA